MQNIPLKVSISPESRYLRKCVFGKVRRENKPHVLELMLFYNLNSAFECRMSSHSEILIVIFMINRMRINSENIRVLL